MAEIAPPVENFSELDIDLVFGGSNPSVILFRTYMDSNESFVEEFNKLAKEYSDSNYNFFTSSIYQGIEQTLAQWAGISVEDLPAIVVLNYTNDMFKYQFEGDVRTATVDDFSEFLSDFENG